MDNTTRGAGGASSTTPKNPFGLLLEWSGENRKWYLLSALLAIVGVAGGVVPYFAAGAMVNGILAGVRDMGLYLRWCGVAAVGYLVFIIFRTTSTALSHRATFATMSKVRRRIAEHLSRVPLGYVVETPSGKLKNIMVEKVDSIETPLAHVIPEMSSNLIIPFAIVIFIFLLDWRMALASLVTIPVGALCYAGMMRNYEERYGEQVAAGEAMSAVAVEYVNGIEVIKAFGQSASSYEKYAKAVTRAARSSIDWMASVEVFQDAALAIWPSTLVTVLPVGCALVLQGTLEPSTFVLVAILSLGIFPSLYAAVSFTDSLAQVGTIVEQIDEVLSQPAQRRGDAPAKLEGSRVDIREARFSYGEEEVLHGIDLSIEPGQVTALVGPSGSGKSTLAGLIAGFWDVDSGSVEVGGVSVNDMAPGQTERNITYVTQDTYLFDDTIMNNIRQGRPGASDEEVVAIAQASGCDDFIRSLENGYQTQVGGSGGHLSGGERQRVAIARAMLKDAPIVILDEATAYADPENEAIVEEAVGRLVAGRTLVVVAHRLSTVVGADKIVVLDDGNVVGEGTHDELMAACPLYKDMYLAHIGSRDEA